MLWFSIPCVFVESGTSRRLQIIEASRLRDTGIKSLHKSSFLHFQFSVSGPKFSKPVYICLLSKLGPPFGYRLYYSTSYLGVPNETLILGSTPLNPKLYATHIYIYIYIYIHLHTQTRRKDPINGHPALPPPFPPKKRFNFFTTLGNLKD